MFVTWKGCITSNERLFSQVESLTMRLDEYPFFMQGFVCFQKDDKIFLGSDKNDVFDHFFFCCWDVYTLVNQDSKQKNRKNVLKNSHGFMKASVDLFHIFLNKIYNFPTQ